MRKICYVSGTRADFGLMKSTLQAINSADNLSLDVVVTGMHLSENFGLTVREIEAAGLNVAARIPVAIDIATGASMARNLAKTLDGCVTAFELLNPDIVLLLGDRGEMLAGALAAIHLNIPVVHIHGGERSGTVDESVRHAVSKLSHHHFVSTPSSRDRLIRMGELGDRVFVTGAPGLDGLKELAFADRNVLIAELMLEIAKPVALMVFHPVLQEVACAEKDVLCILDVLKKQGVQVVALLPNADAGSQAIRTVLENRAVDSELRVLKHFPREKFVSWMAVVDFMIGNSSAGIIEAASFGTPVINIGSRQNLRERNDNVLDITADEASLNSAISNVLKRGRFVPLNVYGDGHAASRIVERLKNLPLDQSVLMKANGY